MRGPRPEGTDGADFAYREVVEDRYRRMARFMKTACLTVPLLAVAVVIKSCWHLVPYLVDEELPKYYAFTHPGMVALATVLFYSARPKKRVRLGVIKAASGFFMLATLSHVMTAWKYHSLDLKTDNYAARLEEYVRGKQGASAGMWLPWLPLLDTGLDMVLLLALLAAAVPIHRWVGDAMDLDRETRQRAQANKAK